MGKKLVTVDGPSDSKPLQLHFEYGTEYEADALVGCDGINSIARQVILGADHPAAAPVYTNGYAHRVVVPLDMAISAFGEDYCSLRTQHGWVGDGGFLLTDLVEDGDAMQVIAGWSNKEPWTHPTPFVEWPKERLREDLADWGDVGKAMTKVSFTFLYRLHTLLTKSSRSSRINRSCSLLGAVFIVTRPLIVRD